MFTFKIGCKLNKTQFNETKLNLLQPTGADCIQRGNYKLLIIVEVILGSQVQNKRRKVTDVENNLTARCAQWQQC